MEPPPFQEAARCDVCKCSFNTFRRRHHCRCCGRTLCHEHSSNQMALPQFGIHSLVRVCYDCFNNPSRSGNDDSGTSIIDITTEHISRLGVQENIDVQTESTVANPTLDVHECKCGMPLCICQAPASDPVPSQNASTSAVPSNPRPKKAVNTRTTTEDMISKSVDSSLKSKQSLFFNLGQGTNGNLDKPCMHYEANGEGLREAVKNHDFVSVKKLLSEGVDANYCDKQGFSLLHLAALFNQTEIAFILMDHGASLDCKNAQGETPLDCAPTMLQYKMQKKMEECVKP